MKKYTLILLSLISFTANSQIVNKFRDSTWFAKGVRFDSEIYLTKGASNGKVLTSNAFGCATWQTASGGVSQTTLNDSITAVRSIRKVDTIYRSLDSIIFKINGIRYSIKDSSGTSSGGTVTSVSVVTANGISGTVANATTTPAITLQVDTISKFATRKQLLDSIDRINTAINTKQETLISGTNIKTVNSNSILGSGNISVGSVISIGTGFGINGGIITTTGTLTIDSTKISTLNALKDSITSLNTRMAIVRDTQSLKLAYGTDSIRMSLTKANSISFAYAYDSVSTNTAGDSIITFKANLRRAYKVNSGGGSSSLSGLTAATTASTLANGANVITWNWSGLSAGTKGLIFGGTDILVNGITIGVGKNQNTSNVAIGYNALNASTGGLYNTAIGSNALNKLTNGLANTAIGESSLVTLTTGTNNIAIGRQALNATSDGADNIGIGDFSLTSMGTAYGNTVIGKDAMYYLNTGNYNVAVGKLAFVNVKGGNNTGVGTNVGYNLTTGTANTIVGYYTGLGITTGSKNTIIGANISGLATTLSNTIILADGDGVIRYYCNSAGSTGIGTSTPNASAKFDVSSTTQGVLLPRMTTTQKNAISSPAEGLEVYDLTLHQKSYYNGTTWINY